MSDYKDNNEILAGTPEEFALDDDRRVKSLSPSALVMRKFARNRLAIVGVVIIVAMFLFSFLGGVLSPYKESQVFLTLDHRLTDWAFATVSKEVLTLPKDPSYSIPISLRGAFVSAIKNGKTEIVPNGETYTLIPTGDAWIIMGHVKVYGARTLGRNYDWAGDIDSELKALFETALADGEPTVVFDGVTYTLSRSGRDIKVAIYDEMAIATQLVSQPLVKGFKPDFALLHDAEEALGQGSTVFGDNYALRDLGGVNRSYVVSQDGTDLCILSRLSIQPRETGELMPLETWLVIRDAIEAGNAEVQIGETDYIFTLENGQYNIRREQDVTVVSMFESPSLAHPFGTDSNGMDVMTRLMHGGRVSLMVGFIVIILGAVLGIILGGIAGYFGKAIDTIIMRTVDVFNCIPTIPLCLIFGSIMEANQVEPQLRIYYLMILLGVLSWPGVARLVRGQILSLREQEFMLATEALGIRVSQRIFKHLVPNVIPQMIVWATMGLGDIIILESTLSFLGLGVKYPMASWGNILNSVNDMHIMVNYLFVWIPAGLAILLTVLGFNFIGDGLRDAFDPRTKR